MASKAELAYQVLFEKVVQAHFQPGALLDEQQLARDLGLGRTPVREAILRLQNDGLLVVLPRRGVMVTALTPSDIRDVLDARLVIECQMARLAAGRITPEQIRRLLHLQNNLQRDVNAEAEAWKICSTDNELHGVVAQGTHNALLIDTSRRLATPMQRLWMFAHQWDPHRDKHHLLPEQWRVIIRFLEEKDAEGAESAMRLYVLHGHRGLAGDSRLTFELEFGLQAGHA